MDIQLVNPLDDVVVFEVALTGDGLLGEARYLLKDLCSGLVRARGWRSISSKLFAYDGYPQLPPFEHVSYSWILVRGGVRPGPKGDSNIRISATPSSAWAANWARICRAQPCDNFRNAQWQCRIWDVAWNVLEVFSPLLPARSKGTAVFFNEIVGVAYCGMG